jgi:hypothetical protein
MLVYLAEYIQLTGIDDDQWQGIFNIICILKNMIGTTYSYENLLDLEVHIYCIFSILVKRCITSLYIIEQYLLQLD